MTHDTRKWELEMKADRVLYRLTVEQMAYLGNGFPWAITEDDLSLIDLVDAVRQAALGLGHRATKLGAP
ncbi:hypothetical protein [Microbacterium sp. MPKO10]|uniref:hypothetical protein n=1 Tax=Microbacterium sp. MPKO10 TaxID=2989818 RepID=UPI00223696AF|nr:hypothetical protein [Microbacterium sp. MPKO10]MCW4458202.1 hypothetical protein [Microbacterium sp. MPKO10]